MIIYSYYFLRSHLESPLHSASSQSPSLTRPRTKAALKGYENLKVSIPTTGIDLQQALDRSPSANGCKLAALADIALGTDVPTRLHQSTIFSNTQKIHSISPRMSSLHHDLVRHNPLSLNKTNLDALAISKNIINSIVNIQKKKKRSVQRTGNRLGFKEKKKKTKGKPTKNIADTATTKPSSSSDKPKDIYDFEESHDSIENEIIPLTHSRPQKSDQMAMENKAMQPAENTTNGPMKKQDDTIDEESSYSDRDDYCFNNSISESGSEEEASEVESVSMKKRSKTPADVQKKCLIMGRIFKNAKKNPEPQSELKEISKPLPKQKLDEIFDNLRSRNENEETEPPIETASKADSAEIDYEKTNQKLNDDDDEEEASGDKFKQSSSGKSRKPREVANLEAEWGMSMEQIKDLIGVGKRKTQRRCTTNQQKKLVETWSSDEYEDFHSTKDIIALIQEAEMKAKRAKVRNAKQHANALEKSEIEKKTATADENKKDSDVKSSVHQLDVNAIADTTENHIESKTENKAKENTSKKLKNRVLRVMSDEIKIDETEKPTQTAKPRPKKTARFSGVVSEDSDFDEHWNKTAKRAKIRNRRRTIASREEMYTDEAPVVEAPKVRAKSKDRQENLSKKVTIVETPAPVPAPAPAKKEIKTNDSSNPAGKTKSVKPMPRRKRIASEMLYYWSSSSSDEEFGRVKTQDNDEDDNTENHSEMEQHGWIVGDSHKKLVTLLAHAKGKNIDDCGVKETASKKK